MNTQTLRIEIDLTEYSESSLMDAIAERCAQNIERQAREALLRQVGEMVQAKMRTAADDIVANYLQRAVMFTNRYGEPSGDGKTLTEYLIEFFTKHMAEKVRVDGRIGDYCDKSQKPRIDWIVEKITTEKLEAAVRDAVAEARKKGEDAMRAAVADLLTKHLPQQS